MKRFFLMMACSIFVFNCWATPICLTQRPNDYLEDTKPQHAPMLTPNVDYESGVLAIYSPYAIEDMMVIIKDSGGEILYTTGVCVSNTATIVLPSSILTSMCTLEIIYGDCFLYGEF